MCFSRPPHSPYLGGTYACSQLLKSSPSGRKRPFFVPPIRGLFWGNWPPIWRKDWILTPLIEGSLGCLPLKEGLVDTCHQANSLGMGTASRVGYPVGLCEYKFSNYWQLKSAICKMVKFVLANLTSTQPCVSHNDWNGKMLAWLSALDTSWIGSHVVLCRDDWDPSGEWELIRSALSELLDYMVHDGEGNDTITNILTDPIIFSASERTRKARHRALINRA